MYRSPRFAFASLALVLAFGLAHAQIKPPEKLPAPVCPAPSIGEPAVTVEVQVLRIGDALFAELMKDNRLNCKHFVTIDGSAAKEMIARILEDSDSERLAAPRICSLSGQEGRITIGQESAFVTDVKVVRFAEQTTLVPQSQMLSSGCSIAVTPTITPDIKHVILRFQAEQSEIPDCEVPTFPVTTFVTPEFEGGAQGQATPFTQFLQQPTLFKRSVTNSFGIADGQTALIYGGHTSRTETQVERVPFFSDLPIIGELFETETEKQVSNHLVYMVTSHIVASPASAAPCQAACCPTMPHCCPAPAPVAPCQAALCAPPLPVGPVHVIASIGVAKGENRNAVAAPFVPICSPMPAPCNLPQPVQMAVYPPMPMPQSCTLPQPVQMAVYPPIPMQVPCKLPEPVNAYVTPRDVSFRCSIIKVDEDFFSRPEGEAWTDLGPTAVEASGKFIDDDTAQRFICAVRAQNGGKLLAQPIMTTRDGHPATFLCGGQAPNDTCIKIVGVNFEERFGVTVPNFTKVQRDFGISLELVPKLSADGKFCNLNMEIKETRNVCNGTAPCEVMVKVPASKMMPEEIRTEVIQAFSLSERTMQTTPCVPLGRCVVMYLNKDETNEGVKHLAVLVTPAVVDRPAERVTTAHAVEPMPAPPQLVARSVCQAVPCSTGNDQLFPCCVQALEARMAQYRKACAEERWGDARRLAAECVQMDPKCFLPK
jgi:Flp pilus assembly secretin CpaC